MKFHLTVTNQPTPWNWVRTTSTSASQKIFYILCNPEVHYRAHNSPPLVNPEPHESCPCSALVLPVLIAFHLRVALRGGLFPSDVPTVSFLFCSVHATCPTHSHPCFYSELATSTNHESVVMQFHGASCSLHVGTDILIFTLFSKTLSLFSSRNASDKAPHAHKEYASRLKLNRGHSFVYYKFSINSEAVTQLLKKKKHLFVYTTPACFNSWLSPSDKHLWTLETLISVMHFLPYTVFCYSYIVLNPPNCRLRYRIYQVTFFLRAFLFVLVWWNVFHCKVSSFVAVKW